MPCEWRLAQDFSVLKGERATFSPRVRCDGNVACITQVDPSARLSGEPSAQIASTIGLGKSIHELSRERENSAGWLKRRVSIMDPSRKRLIVLSRGRWRALSSDPLL